MSHHAELETPPLPASSAVPSQEAEALLAEVLAQLTEGVAILTAEGSIVSWNPRAAQLTGYTLAEVNAVGLARLFDQPQVATRLVQEALAGTPTVGERLLLVRADGRRLPVSIRCSPLRQLGSSQRQAVVVLRDLSELEALHRRMVQSERLSLLGRLAGAVTHEIRTPLTAIFLHADLLEDEVRRPDGGDRQRILDSLAAIKEEVTRLYDLAQQYLSLARLPELPREPVDFAAYLQAFCRELQPRLAERGVVLRLESDAPLGTVALHGSSFRRLLLNLSHNALEAMPQGGTLSLRAWATATHVFLAISDSGCGIPPEHLPLLFSPFHSTKPEGTGLGLYLVREIIRAHGGEIEVASTLGVGTTFTLRLPRHGAGG
ncbi:MAG: hypothetical protein KatS3mg131_1459 [Candidatus Tectimicrobiota bacterium]|nr:MAG: hypothetical protein KatS3mg131_1459 [Candidatus Tectomicrobia bacterium]